MAYILRQTLGWLDVNGKPLQQDIVVSYRDLIQRAGVSRGAISPALKEAVDSGFLVCRKQGSAKSVGDHGQSGAYTLRWNSESVYTTQLQEFSGFYVGEGHRTPIPNAFFDELIVSESLAVLKVVGTVLRHTVGYQNQFGRRQVAPLSYRYISQYAQLSQGRVLSRAIRTALASGYIECVEQGKFAMKAESRRAASYRVRWLNKAENDVVGSKKPPIQNVATNRFKKATGDGSKKPLPDRFKKASTEKTESNNTLKQQNVVVRNLKEGIEALKSEGMDGKTATRLATEFGTDLVIQQVQWLDERKPTENRVGMLRKAIEESWSAPRNVQIREKREQERQRFREKEIEQRQEDAASNRRKKERHERKERLLTEWGSASLEERAHWIRAATKRETSATLVRMLRGSDAQTSNPRMQILDEIARERNLPPITLVSEQSRCSGHADSDAPLDAPKGVPITDQPAGHQTGRYNRTLSSLGQAEKSSSR